MKKKITVLFITLGIVLISGCSLAEQKSVNNSAMTEEIKALQEQTNVFSSQMEILKQENEQLKQENNDLKKEVEKYKQALLQEKEKIKQGDIKTENTEEASIKNKEYFLYYHNLEKDKASYDWISFNKEFILPVKRNVEISKTPIKDVFSLLFEADLTEADLKNGFVAGVFKTYDFSIKSIALNNGVLKIDFINQNFTLESLSSAENSVFVNSVRKTALQFPEIDKIQFLNGMVIGVKNPDETQM